MKLTFQAVAEELPGPHWKANFERTWPDVSAWFLVEGDGKRPGYMTCRRALREHMPELVPTWERLVDLAGGGDQAARMLSLFCPPPYMVACSQALWLRDEPVLIRNYDYHPARCEGLLLHSAWHGTRVIASNDSLWGALDGINEHGLAATLAFGGRKAVGKGFGIPLIVRYVLELCRDVDAAVAVLRRVPSHMAYTVGLVDKSGRHATVYVGPDQPAEVLATCVSTNHQRDIEWPEHAELTATVPRANLLAQHVAEPGVTVDALIERFLEPPLFASQYARAFGTLYTAAYWPRQGRMVYRWPNRSWHQSFDRFVEGAAIIEYVGA